MDTSSQRKRLTNAPKFSWRSLRDMGSNITISSIAAHNNNNQIVAVAKIIRFLDTKLVKRRNEKV